MTPAHPALGVAVVGCGTISDEYLRNLRSFPDIEVQFCADLDLERAKGQAARYGVPGAGSLAQALEHPGVELVVNLSVPAAHAEVAASAVAAGKHVWNEKPLTTDPASGRELLAAAAAAGVRVGCAPDTVLGPGLQTARRLVAAGAIGTPQTALALMQGPGPQNWHPSPQFLFQRGAGPLFDVGPYYLSALGTLLGPVSRVAAVGRRAAGTRVAGSGPNAGTAFPVEVPTHVAALAEYSAGAAASMVFSFDSPLRRQGFIEVTGTEATMAVPDPNTFGGDVRLYRPDGGQEVVTSAGPLAGRGVGVADMARALHAGEPHRASAEMALHVLDVMAAIERSAATAAFEPVGSRFTVPEPLPDGWDPHVRSTG